MFRNVLMSTSDAVLLFDAGYGQAQGGRKFQEDRCAVVLPDQFPANTDDKLAFFAVYDGHGTDLVSNHAQQDLHFLVAKRPEFQTGDYEGAIKGALADEDGILLSYFKNKNPEPAVSGSTVAICLVNLTKGDLVVGNLGDSHIILAERDPKTEQPYRIRRLTKSHKPDVPSEQARIEDAGGNVSSRSGTARVGTLNMSRAIGDLRYKNPVNHEDSSQGLRHATSVSPESRGDFLSNEPYLTRLVLLPDHRYVIVAVSDGVSDRVDDVSLVQHVMKLSMRGLRAGDIAQEIATTTCNSANSDNGSCIVALFDGQES
ncbi:hypothetical protein ASPZODRAFT_115749 [Penicilliopsis zonata CBS 506.65]|uniref:protein-serine/threonine phosphatase n=1 Tax=Penicilliopsis zonata CBS 506.65 TaxID=1073090 RepID=A0A1L9SIL6_9EURO|nr:hypothetical protein ASPZODRAFT_115749 [Penicilliopsis zonata CBS 506.65]OJJ46956.1 hypothetical protein ASPZODRAFT_115749 [Penicilliopsis zonata CBS 506.65]